MVVGTDGVDGQYRSAGVKGRGRREEFEEALPACPRAEPELGREASFLESGGKMLRATRRLKTFPITSACTWPL